MALAPASRPELVQATGDEPIAPSRALVPVAAARHEDGRPRGRPSAFFVAHLIATKAQLPQTRERRRADPADASAAYAAGVRPGASSGRVLARVA